MATTPSKMSHNITPKPKKQVKIVSLNSDEAQFIMRTCFGESAKKTDQHVALNLRDLAACLDARTIDREVMDADAAYIAAAQKWNAASLAERDKMEYPARAELPRCEYRIKPHAAQFVRDCLKSCDHLRGEPGRIINVLAMFGLEPAPCEKVDASLGLVDEPDAPAAEHQKSPERELLVSAILAIEAGEFALAAEKLTAAGELLVSKKVTGAAALSLKEYFKLEDAKELAAAAS